MPLPRPDELKAGILEQLESHDIKHGQIMADDIQLLLEPNPRKVKNFVNGLCTAWAVLGAKEWVGVEDQETARRFVMFHYMQQYHRAVWRLLERQPDALPFLWAVVTCAEPGAIEAISSDLDPQAQRLLMEMFRRVFSHVLKNTVDSNDDYDTKHGSEDLDCAVENFIQRQDRKRSDEYLCKMLTDLTGPDSIVDDSYLYAEQQEKQE
jgi:hypothetical protein